MEIRSVKQLSSNEMESVIRVQIIGEIACVSLLKSTLVSMFFFGLTPLRKA